MLYLNQRKFYDVPYNHNVDFGGAPEERRNVGTSGCGICCMSMVVNHLTGKDFPVKDCVRLAESCGAETMWVDLEGNCFYTPGFQNWICG